MKYLIIVMLMVLNNVYAGGSAQVGSGFNYQGELQSFDNIVSGDYDFSFRLYNAQSGGVPVSNIEDHFDIQVSNGHFTIDDLDFGDAVYNGDQLWLEIKVKLVGAATFETLSPLQKISAIPYAVQAEFVNENSIGSNEIIDGSVNSSDIANNAITTAKLAEQSVGTDELKDEAISSSTIADDAINKFHISDNAIETNHIKDNTITASKISDSGASTGDVLQFDGNDWVTTALSNAASPWNTNGANINYTAGEVSIGSTTIGAGLLVEVPSGGGHVFRARVGSSTKLGVHNNGGTSMGSFDTPPTNGLKVSGNIKQPINSNGIIKYMVHATCADASSSITKSYDGINPENVNDPITISSAVSSAKCTITFPYDIDDRYWQVSTITSSFGDVFNTTFTAKCYLTQSSSNSLDCEGFRYDLSTGNVSKSTAQIMILIY